MWTLPVGAVKSLALCQPPETSADSFSACGRTSTCPPKSWSALEPPKDAAPVAPRGVENDDAGSGWRVMMLMAPPIASEP